MQYKKIGDVKAVHSSKIESSPIGIGLEKLDRNVFAPEKCYDKIANLGVKWVRIQSGWERTEVAKGVYDFAWLDSIVDNLLQRGLIPWMCLCYGHGLYNQEAAKVFGAVGCPPIFSEEEKLAWHNYVVATTKHFANRVKYYEVWNEPDGIWCWKHGVNATEYGELVIATSKAVKSVDSSAKIVGGVTCFGNIEWVNQMFKTKAANYMDCFSYHSYDIDECRSSSKVKILRALAHSYNPKLEIIQGETGGQSSSKGAGALHDLYWTEDLQAKFMSRFMIKNLLDQVKFTSYFTTVDMIEALNGTIADKQSYLDYGYFGVLGAEFDENGFATGEYRCKKSYRTLQTIASLFKGKVEVVDMPISFSDNHCPFTGENDNDGLNLEIGGFKKENGSSAFVYWKNASLFTENYKSTVSLTFASLPEKVQLIRVTTGEIFEIPAEKIKDLGDGCFKLEHITVMDEPLIITFGNFA